MSVLIDAPARPLSRSLDSTFLAFLLFAFASTAPALAQVSPPLSSLRTPPRYGPLSERLRSCPRDPRAITILKAATEVLGGEADITKIHVWQITAIRTASNGNLSQVMTWNRKDNNSETEVKRSDGKTFRFGGKTEANIPGFPAQAVRIHHGRDYNPGSIAPILLSSSIEPQVCVSLIQNESTLAPTGVAVKILTPAPMNSWQLNEEIWYFDQNTKLPLLVEYPHLHQAGSTERDAVAFTEFMAMGSGKIPSRSIHYQNGTAVATTEVKSATTTPEFTGKEFQ